MTQGGVMEECRSEWLNGGTEFVVGEVEGEESVVGGESGTLAREARSNMQHGTYMHTARHP